MHVSDVIIMVKMGVTVSSLGMSLEEFLGAEGRSATTKGADNFG